MSTLRTHNACRICVSGPYSGYTIIISLRVFLTFSCFYDPRIILDDPEALILSPSPSVCPYYRRIYHIHVSVFSNFNLIISYWYQCLQNCWNTIFPRVSFLLSSETTIEGTEKRCFIYFNSHGSWHMVHQTYNRKWTVVGNSVALTRGTLRICYLQSANFNICKT